MHSFSQTIAPPVPTAGTHNKAAILARSAKSAGKAEGKSNVDKWKASHPMLTSVEMNGDIAIVTFGLDKKTAPKPVMSCDISCIGMDTGARCIRSTLKPKVIQTSCEF
jgi:hypothetical protein